MKRLFVLFVLAGLFLFGCTSIGDSFGGSGTGISSIGKSTSYAAPTPMAAPSQARAASYESTAVSALDTQLLTKQGTATLKVPENTLEARVDSLKGALKTSGANLNEVRFYEYSDRKQYVLTIKVPPARFEEIIANLKTYGEVKDLSISVEDVSQQYHDLDIRIANRQIELTRLYQLYNLSADVDNLLSVEQEITRVETELDVLKSQKQELDRQIAKSTLAITIYEEKPATAKIEMSLGDLATGFLGALWTGITFLVIGIGFFLPLAIIILVIYTVWKKIRAKKADGEGVQGNKKK